MAVVWIAKSISVEECFQMSTEGGQEGHSLSGHWGTVFHARAAAIGNPESLRGYNRTCL